MKRQDQILIDGPFVLATETSQYFRQKEIYEEVRKASMEDIWKYCTNNETLAAVDSEQHYWVSENRKEIEKLLIASGYQEGDFHVPHSNDNGIELKRLLSEFNCILI